jgi:hypothetical protein
LKRERDTFHEEADRELRELGLLPSACMKKLEFAAQRYGTNVLREATSISDASLLKELAETIERSDDRIGRRISIWSDDLVAVFCDDAPGHNAAMSHHPNHQADEVAGSETQASRYLHLSGPLVAETLENMQRDNANKSKLVQVRFQHSIDSCLPAPINEELATQMYRLVLDETVGKGVAPRVLAPILKALAEHLISLGTMENAALRQTMLAQNRAASSDIERCNLIDLMFAEFVQASRAEPKDHGLVLRKFIIGFFSIALEVAPTALRRRIIAGIAGLSPTDFRVGLIGLRSRIKDQYGGQGDEHGKSRSMWLWRSGHAKWMLISDVLDVVWPPSNGPLGEDTRRFEPACVEDVIHQTQDYAIHIIRIMQGDTAAQRAKAPVNGDHIKLMSRWRTQVYELREVVLAMDHEIIKAERAKHDPKGSENERMQARSHERQLRNQIESIQIWRRELERMLRQADYEKGKKGAAKKRPTGAKIQLPEFDLTWRTLPQAEKLTAIAAAAVGHTFVPVQ